MQEDIFRYFPGLSNTQKEQMSVLKDIYAKWNSMINVISRKDIDNFNVHHLLHSLALAKVISFVPGTRILDVGTGGGFPGIPLAIMFPEADFTLLDSIGKKIKVVTAVAEELQLTNIYPTRKRVEEEKGIYHFVVSRAVTDFKSFVNLTSKNIGKQGNNTMKNGILYLKGGDLTEELSDFRHRTQVWNLGDIFTEPFFETKRIVYLPV
jgi:16S rRNA (guanine527-N7)-methyltransferase